ncbi:CpaD family pilus assembly protein [Chelativorans sp. YIM 93263]|uniref:CpaD family pilus assembly protein n=1 Tax=Chelativorans sp. YIM 93263 TaxID=2906648 RepID=UPI0023787041|nr:CpaD family pilus assembly lipoprotein [Chelativorans sp. YIM 93263]
MFDTLMRKLLPCAVGIALAGCAGTDSVVVGAVPDDYRTNHPIVISERDKTLDLPVGTSTLQMTPDQASAIRGFLSEYADNGAPRVTVLSPSGSVNAAVAQSVAMQFAEFMRREGVPAGHIQHLSYNATGEGSPPIRLAYPVMEASVGQCGRWPEDILDNADNRHFANFGCSYQQNLAAQVANPNDFLGPRKVTSIDAENRAEAIGRYKRGQVSQIFRSQSEINY